MLIQDIIIYNNEHLFYNAAPTIHNFFCTGKAPPFFPDGLVRHRIRKNHGSFHVMVGLLARTLCGPNTARSGWQSPGPKAPPQLHLDGDVRFSWRAMDQEGGVLDFFVRAERGNLASA